MANQDFDTVILNPLERPVSQDLDAAQSELNRTLRDVLAPLFAAGGGAPTDGFLAAGFQPTQDLSVGLGVVLKAGMGFQFTSDAQTDINAGAGAVLGLNDLSRYKPLVLSADKTVLCAPAPAAGQCRRDLIQVKWNRSFANEIRDVLNPTTYVFTGQSIPKTMTFDLSAVAPEIVAVGGTASAAIAIKTGQTVAYVDENSFLSAPLPAVDSGYMAVAVLNVGFGVGGITADRIVDRRSTLLPNGITTIGAAASVQQGNSAFADLRKSIPAGWKLCAYQAKPGFTTDQAVQFVLVAGDTTQFSVGGDQMALRTKNTAFAGDVPNLGRDRLLYEGYNDGSLTGGVTLLLQERIRGLSANYNTLGAFEVAVGQPFISFSAVYGRENLTLASFSATRLDGSLSTPTGLPGTNIVGDFTTASTAGRAGSATLGNSGTAPTTTPVTSTGASGSISSSLDVNALAGGGSQQYETTLVATLQHD